MNMDDFSAADIYVGKPNGEEGTYYWGSAPADFFDEGKFETEDGFIATIV